MSTYYAEISKLMNLFAPECVVVVNGDYGSWSKIFADIKIKKYFVYDDFSSKKIQNTSLKNRDVVLKTSLWNSSSEIFRYAYNNKFLDGFISPEFLSSTWRNLRVISKKVVKAIGIDSFCSNKVIDKISKFLIIEDLSGYEIIKSMDFGFVDVLCVNTIVGDYKDMLDQKMLAVGFISMQTFVGTNPKMITCIYVKNFKTRCSTKASQITKLKSNYKNAEASIAEHVKMIESLKVEHSDKMRLMSNNIHELELRSAQLQAVLQRQNELLADMLNRKEKD